jgi:hypothetical protein
MSPDHLEEIKLQDLFLGPGSFIRKDSGPIHFILTIPLEYFSLYIRNSEAVPNHGGKTIIQFILL